MLLICFGITLLIYSLLRCLQRLDREAAGIGKYSIITQGSLCMLCSEWIYYFYSVQAVGSAISLTVLMPMLLLSAFCGSLLAACVMDLETCMIYNYVWWAGGAIGAIFILLGAKDAIAELLVYVLLQEILFSRMYGRADCHAFGVCAMVEAAFGMHMRAYLIHMLLAFGLLAIVQGLRRNIGRDGNLKCPVAFLPYIAVSFWGIMLLYILQGNSC